MAGKSWKLATLRAFLVYHPEGGLHYYIVTAYKNNVDGYNIRAMDHGKMRSGLDESCNPNPGPNDMVPMVK